MQCLVCSLEDQFCEISKNTFFTELLWTTAFKQCCDEVVWIFPFCNLLAGEILAGVLRKVFCFFKILQAAVFHKTCFKKGMHCTLLWVELIFLWK